MKDIYYQSKFGKLTGSNYVEVKKNAETIFKQIKSKTKRRPYIKSAYFNKQKIFFDYFWEHLFQKSLKDRTLRLKYFYCAIDLIKSSRIAPESKDNHENKNETFHRFSGKTKSKEKFAVQIKENKKTGKKDFMSCFPWE